MNVICPYCAHGMTVKGAKPGRFKPKCAKCIRLFLLTVAADESTRSAPLPEAAADPNATGAEMAAPKKKAAPSPDATAAPADNPDATAAPPRRGSRRPPSRPPT